MERGAERWEADPGPQGQVVLRPGQLFSTVLQFDVPEEGEEALHLWWEREGGTARLLATEVPRHEEPAGQPPTEWPALVDALPPGRAGEGASLYAGRLACASCHGQPELPGSNTVGPPLGELARAAPRVPGKSVAQYVYESMLAPDAFLAPGCPGGQPCAAPSAMPHYGELMSSQDMADVVAFLLGPRIAQGP